MIYVIIITFILALILVFSYVYLTLKIKFMKEENQKKEAEKKSAINQAKAMANFAETKSNLQKEKEKITQKPKNEALQDILKKNNEKAIK